MTSLPQYALDVKGLRKVYKAANGNPPKEALKGIDLQIPQGSFFALLGPNGAGKSTFINTLAGLVLKTEGDVSIWGYDLDKQNRMARNSIGVVPQEINIDPFFTPRESLELQAGYYGIPKGERRTMEILAAVGLSDKADSYSRSLSGGMKRRLLVAKAMVHNPPILILDEPTAGVDVELRRQLWDYVKELNARGTTIILTTHYLEEAEELCDEIAIINRGEVVVRDKMRSLLKRLDSKTLHITLDQDLAEIPEALADLHAELKTPREIVVLYKPSDTSMQALLGRVQESGLTIQDLSTEEADLEDIFLQLTKSEA